MEKVNVLCMKWGTKYGPEYVNRLYWMVQRHLKRPHHFYCLTDDTDGIVSGVKTLPLPQTDLSSKSVSWVAPKLCVLAKDLGPIQGKVLFLDLDVVITARIDCFFDYTNTFCIIENWTQKSQGIGNSSVFFFKVGEHADVLEAYLEDPEKAMREHRNEQIFLSRKIGLGNMRYWPESWCVSFKETCCHPKWMRLFRPPALPIGAKIVVFHGSPKPDEAAEGRWPGRLIPYAKPAPWILDHWYDQESQERFVVQQ